MVTQPGRDRQQGLTDRLTIAHTLIYQELNSGGAFTTRLEPAQAPDKMLLKTGFTKARAANHVVTKISQKEASKCFKSL